MLSTSVERSIFENKGVFLRRCLMGEGAHRRKSTQENTARLFLCDSPTHFSDEYQTQSAQVLALPLKRAHLDDSNDTPQHIGVFQVDFPLLWIKDYPGLS